MLGLDALKKALQLQEEQQELTDYGDEFKPTSTHATLRGYRAPTVSAEMGEISQVSRNGVGEPTVTAELGPIQELSRNGVPSDYPVMRPTSPLGMVRDAAFGAGTNPATPPPSPQVDEMEQANRVASETGLISGMGRAGSRFAATVGKIPQDTSHWDKMGTEANQRRSAVSKFLQAKALKGIEAEADKKKADADALDKIYGRKHQDATRAETERHNRAMEARPPGGGIHISPELGYRMGRDTQEDARREREREEKRQAQVTEIEERYKGIQNALDEMEGLVKEDGTFEVLGPHNATLEGLISSYATDMSKMRDKDSAAREGEVALEKKALPVTGMGVRNSTALELIRNQRARVRERRNEAYKIRGLTPPEAEDVVGFPGAPMGESVRPPDAAGGIKKQYSPSRNQTRLIHPDGRVEVVDGQQ